MKWHKVEDVLPGYKHNLVLVRYSLDDSLLISTGVFHLGQNKVQILNGEADMISVDNVTHWAELPSDKGFE